MYDASVSISRSMSKSDVSELSSIDQPLCWICHEGSNEANGELFQPCNCPAMTAHRVCLSRWNLQSAGKPEERKCRFCQSELPDWREAHEHLPKATPVMTVMHLGQSHQVKVFPGPDGREQFSQAIRDIFGLSPEDQVALTFGCKVPSATPDGHVAATELTLEGWEAFDAAVHCAAISAGQREQRRASESAAADRRASNTANAEPQPGGGLKGGIRRLFRRQSATH